MENQNEKEVRLNKIPIRVFIDALLDLYNSGADYIDLIGKPNETQDTIGIVVRLEYMTNGVAEEEMSEEDEKEFIEGKLDIKLSDDDLNQLL